MIRLLFFSTDIERGKGSSETRRRDAQSVLHFTYIKRRNTNQTRIRTFLILLNYRHTPIALLPAIRDDAID